MNENQDNAFQTRTRKCFENRPNCRKINGKMVVEDKEPCTIKCKSKDFSPQFFIINFIFSPLHSEDRKWLEWGQWSACSATCGRGKRHRERFCLAGNSESQECPKSKEMQEEVCQEAKCHGIIPFCKSHSFEFTSSSRRKSIPYKIKYFSGFQI